MHGSCGCGATITTLDEFLEHSTWEHRERYGQYAGDHRPGPKQRQEAPWWHQQRNWPGGESA